MIDVAIPQIAQELKLTHASVKDDVLTVYAAYRNNDDKALKRDLDYREVYYLDTQNKKKFGVLKDSSGVFIANPRSGDHYFYVRVPPGEKQIVWMKFPGPPSAVTEVDLSLPDVLPFDGLPVSR